MTSPADQLTARWQVLAGDLGWPPDRARLVGQELIDRYGEGHRRYHDQGHVLAVLDALDDLTDGSPSAVTRLAAWYHDAIYDGIAGEDEEASARLAERQLRELGLAADKVGRVAGAVRATAHHAEPASDHDPETALVLDADLSPLAAGADTYAANTEAIRAEYSHVSDEAFRAGRLAVIEALLGREHLFMTPQGRARYEEQARTNLSRERAQLLGH